MKRTIAIVTSLTLILSLITLPSCKNKSAERTQKKVELEKVKAIEGQIETNVYPLPTSAEVIKMLTEVEVGYIIGISNSVENGKKYFTSQSRALNLGVYGADRS